MNTIFAISSTNHVTCSVDMKLSIRELAFWLARNGYKEVAEIEQFGDFASGDVSISIYVPPGKEFVDGSKICLSFDNDGVESIRRTGDRNKSLNSVTLASLDLAPVSSSPVSSKPTHLPRVSTASRRRPVLSSEQRHEIRKRHVLTGETPAQLGLTFSAMQGITIGIIKSALQEVPGTRELREDMRTLSMVIEPLVMEEYLCNPVKAAELREQARKRSNPTPEFLQECTTNEGKVLKAELFEVWEKWATQRKLPLVSTTGFFERIRLNAPYAVGEVYEKDGHTLSIFRGISLISSAKRKYLKPAKAESVVAGPSEHASLPSNRAEVVEPSVVASGPAAQIKIPTASAIIPFINSIPLNLKSDCMAKLANECSQTEAWAFVVDQYPDCDKDDVIVRSWLSASQEVGGSRDEDNFTSAEWAKVRDAVIRKLDLIRHKSV